MWTHASPMPAAEVGDGKGSRSGWAPGTLTGPTGELFIDTPHLLPYWWTLVWDTKAKKKGLIWDISKENNFFFEGGMTKKIKMNSYLKVICLIVVHVQSSVQLTVSGYRQLFSTGDPIVDGLTCILLHLNVVELTEIAKPLDELRGDAPVELLNLNVEKDKNIAVFSLHSLSIWNIFKVPLSSLLGKVLFKNSTQTAARQARAMIFSWDIIKSTNNENCISTLPPLKWKPHVLNLIFLKPNILFATLFFILR